MFPKQYICIYIHMYIFIWYSPLLSGYCWRKCLYSAVVVFFMKCLWCDLHFASALQTYFFPPLGCCTYKCIPAPFTCWKTKSFLLGLGIKFSLQWLLTSFKTIKPPCKRSIIFGLKCTFGTMLGCSVKNDIRKLQKKTHTNLPHAFPNN